MNIRSKIKILLVDDHPIVLSGLRSTLSTCLNFEIVGEALDGIEAIQEVKSLNPDIVLMDIVMPGMNGIQTTKILRRESPGVKILALSMHDEKEYVVEIIRAGARGYILKDSTPTELIQAIEAVNRGEAYFSPNVSKVLLNELNIDSQSYRKKPADKLSPRETEVLRLIGEGFSNKEIADKLFLGLRTIETHRERIMKKLDIHNTAGLTRYAISKGIVRVEE